MLNATDHERQASVDYLARQASDERVELVQKVYSERLHGTTHDIWDIHTDKDRWWVITEPTNLYSQSQFPNMDLALTFHVGLCLRIPRTDRRDVTGRPAELKQSDFVGWAEAIADIALAGPSQKVRRQLLKSSAKATWQFVNWLTHSRSAHFHDAEAALAATEQTLSLFTTATIRHIRGVPECCPSCGSQRLAPERGMHASDPDKLYERAVCTACGWAGEPVEVPVAASASEHTQPAGDCVIMTVPLRGARPPKPTGDHE